MISPSELTKSRFKKSMSAIIIAGLAVAIVISIILALIMGDDFSIIIPIILAIVCLGASGGCFYAMISAKVKKGSTAFEIYNQKGCCIEFCEAFADAFVNNKAKPANCDVIKLASFYDKAGDVKMAEFYLDKLEMSKLSCEDKYEFCCEQLYIYGKTGNWRDGEDFRSENINFIQKYMQHKNDTNHQVTMYIALALIDCAAKKFADAFSLLNFGYKPKGKNDTYFLNILITAVYIYKKMEDESNLSAAVANAYKFLNKFTSFEYSWSKEAYEKRIANAENGIL